MEQVKLKFAKHQKLFHFCGEPFVVEQAGESWVEPVNMHKCPVKGQVFNILSADACFSSMEEVVLAALGNRDD